MKVFFIICFKKRN